MRLAQNHWYPLLLSHEVARRPVGVARLGRRFVFWRSGDGPARSLTELEAAAADTEPGLEFLFPGVWLLNLGSRLKNLIAFVPINEQQAPRSGLDAVDDRLVEADRAIVQFRKLHERLVKNIVP